MCPQLAGIWNVSGFFIAARMFDHKMFLVIPGSGMNKSSLRRQLVLPFVFLVMFVSAAIGWISFRAGENAIADLTARVLVDMVNRIGSATEQHLAGAQIALQSAAPDPKTVPKAQAFPEDVASLEQRLWTASGLFMDVNNYVYFGGADGRFVGVNRVSKDMVEFYLREPNAEQRQVFSVQAPGDRGTILRADDYDARTRPWYALAARQKEAVWSPVYNDDTSKEPTITLAKPVYHADRTLAGVVATNVTLKSLSDFLRSLLVSRHGVAFVVDADGLMVATSGDEPPFDMARDTPQRKRADDMATPLIRDAYAKVLEWKQGKTDLRTATAHEFSTASGLVEIAAALVGNKYGVNWISVVAIPREDFMGGLTLGFYQSVFIAGICVLLALILGLSILNRVLRDIRMLINAVKKVGNGEPLPALNINRNDEIGQLAQTFNEMEHNLHFDKLTAVFNRESLNAQTAFLQRQAALNPSHEIGFALLFIDLDNFKQVNDRYGHDAGDQVLVTVAGRLKAAVRASDIVARYGGDEFVVLLKGVNGYEDVAAAEEKIREAVEQPIAFGHGAARVGVSLGWAMFPEDGKDTPALLKVADFRMFETKRIRKATG